MVDGIDAWKSVPLIVYYFRPKPAERKQAMENVAQENEKGSVRIFAHICFWRIIVPLLIYTVL